MALRLPERVRVYGWGFGGGKNFSGLCLNDDAAGPICIECHCCVGNNLLSVILQVAINVQHNGVSVSSGLGHFERLWNDDSVSALHIRLLTVCTGKTGIHLTLDTGQWCAVTANKTEQVAR